MHDDTWIGMADGNAFHLELTKDAPLTAMSKYIYYWLQYRQYAMVA